MRIKLIDAVGNVVYSDLLSADFHFLDNITKESEIKKWMVRPYV